MADYHTPTVVQQTIPNDDMTPLERLLLTNIFDEDVINGIHPVSTHPSVLEGLVDGSRIRWGLRVLKAVVSACLLDGYSADRLGS